MPTQPTELNKVAEKHTLHRFFLGPLPEHVLSDAHRLAIKSASGKEPRSLLGFTQTQRPLADDDEPVNELINQYAYAFHLKLGGSEGDWSEEQESDVKNEMFRRWKESAWGRFLRGRKDSSNARHRRWVLPNETGFFQVGEFLGLNTYIEPPPRSPRSVATGNSSTRADPSASQVPLGDPSMTTGGTFLTARSHISPEPEPYTMPSQPSFPEGTPTLSPDESPDIHAVTSTASLLPVLAADTSQEGELECTHVGPGLKPALRAHTLSRAKSDGAVDGSSSALLPLGRGKGKAKKVVRLPPDLSPPAPPSEVLGRTGSQIQETSAAAVEELQVASAPPVLLDIPDEAEDAKMKDRMVVRVAYSEDGSVGPRFDEVQCRSARNLLCEDWAEFMVVWRNDRLELYSDYKLPGREWFAGHKHLAYVVPLKSVRTRLSLYSFTDMSFCITCPPASLRAGMKILLPFQRRTGTNVFIFKPRSRSRSTDWIWHLWRELEMSSQLPSFIEVRSPVLDTRMKIDIPGNTDYSIFSYDNLIALSMRTFSTIQDWDVIVQKRLAEGGHLELAWRLDTNLDWVWWHNDVYGNPRVWEVLAGLALNQAGRAAHLEVRVAEHMASQLHIKDGHQLPEPPSIEGYVSRIRSASGSHEEVYLSVHHGLLFTLPPSHPHTPNLPGVVPVPYGSDHDIRDAFRHEEVRRGAAQVLTARSVLDLRAVIIVRRAFRTAFHPSHPIHNSTPHDPEDEHRLHVEVAHEESDALDAGGDAGLTGDVSMTRMRRCFELVLKTGHVIRFETWSARVAIEWIERLRALIQYWKLRHIVDTRQEMDVVHLATGRPRITPHRLRDDEDDKPRPPEPPSNPAVALPYLTSMYHWCVYEGCRPITKCGRIYVRKGPHGRYKLVELFLVGGQLVQYYVKPKSMHYPRRERSVSLLDAYIMSGVFAAQALPKGQYNPNNPVIPRRYADGLESDDMEENMLFVVYYVGRKAGQAEKVPSLNATKKMMVFRCRSRVERDVWCWALNTEIEKLARESRDREEKWRSVGAPIPHRMSV